MKIQNYALTLKKLSFVDCLNKQATAGYPTRNVNDVVDTVSFGEALKSAHPETDRVVSPARENPASDALLLNLVDKLPRSLANMTWGAVKRWVHHGETSPEILKSPFTPGKRAPLRTDRFLQSLGGVMKEFPQYPPHLGSEHKWSKASAAFRGLGYSRRVWSAIKGERSFPFPTFKSSKLLCALGLGATSVVMPTGSEGALKSWILDRKEGSVLPHQLFRESYRLNKGDLYATLLTAENVLSEGLYTSDRQDREVTRKLGYLRNDSAPHGDNFGGWYHLFGSALYSLVRPEWKARLSMKIESAGSYILEGRDPQEDHINRIGVEVGRGLRRMVTEGIAPDSRVRSYLDRTEFGWTAENVGRWTVTTPE